MHGYLTQRKMHCTHKYIFDKLKTKLKTQEDDIIQQLEIVNQKVDVLLSKVSEIINCFSVIH